MMFSVMVTTRCNLNCKYCYEGKKSNKDMSKETADRVVDWILKMNTEDVINIQFHGGEPLLNFEIIKYILLKLKKNKKVEPRMTTNCYYITNEIAEFLKENNFEVYVSIDGPKNVNDINRVDHNGNGSFDKIIEGIRILQSYGNKVHARGTVTPETAKYYHESGLYLLNNISDSVGIEPDFSTSKWDKDSIKVLINEIEKNSKLELEGTGITLDISSKDRYHKLGKCDGAITNYFISEDGDLYPCLFAYIGKFERLGDVINGQTSSIDVEDIYSIEYEKCSNCVQKDTCTLVRCKYLNKLQTGTYNSIQQCSCMMEKAIYHCLNAN